MDGRVPILCLPRYLLPPLCCMDAPSFRTVAGRCWWEEGTAANLDWYLARSLPAAVHARSLLASTTPAMSVLPASSSLPCLDLLPLLLFSVSWAPHSWSTAITGIAMSGPPFGLAGQPKPSIHVPCLLPPSSSPFRSRRSRTGDFSCSTSVSLPHAAHFCRLAHLSPPPPSLPSLPLSQIHLTGRRLAPFSLLPYPSRSLSTNGPESIPPYKDTSSLLSLSPSRPFP